MSASHAWASKLAVEVDGTFDSGSVAMEFLSCSLKQTIERINSEGLRGTRSRHGERTKLGRKRIAGDVGMNPTPVELDWWLPRILGANESSNVFAVADTLPDFWTLVDRIAKVHKYTECKVARAVFRASAGQLLQLTVSIVGKTEVELSAGSYPSITINAGDSYAFHEGVLTLQGSTREIEEFELTIDNVIDPKFRNSQTATDLTPGDRIVSFSCRLAYDSTNADVYTNESGGTFASGELEFTSGSLSTTFALNKLISEPASPDVPTRGQELMLPLSYRAHMTSSTREIVVTNVSS